MFIRKTENCTCIAFIYILNVFPPPPLLSLMSRCPEYKYVTHQNTLLQMLSQSERNNALRSKLSLVLPCVAQYFWNTEIPLTAERLYDLHELPQTFIRVCSSTTLQYFSCLSVYTLCNTSKAHSIMCIELPDGLYPLPCVCLRPSHTFK